MDQPWKTVSTDSESEHHIQPQKGKIGQIILGQRFLLKMRMDETKSPESQDPRSVAGELRKTQPFLVSYDDGLNAPSTPNENTYLAADFIRQFG